MPVPGAGLVLLGRSYCHLCDDMLEAISRAFPRVDVTEVDVDSDPELERRYGELVPVLLLDGVEVCHYHFSAEMLDTRLRQRCAENRVKAPPEC